MLTEAVRGLWARPRILGTCVAMVVVAVLAMVVIPTLTTGASRRVLADLDALGSNAWIVTPRQPPTGPRELIPPGGLARASDLPGVQAALHVVKTNLSIYRSHETDVPTRLAFLGLDATPGAGAVRVTQGTYRPVPGLRFALIGAQAAAEIGMDTLPSTLVVDGLAIIVTGVLVGDPLLPEFDDAVVTDGATALAMDPTALDEIVIRDSGGLRPDRIAGGIDPLSSVTLDVAQPTSLVQAREQSSATLSGLALVAGASAFGLAVLGIAILLSSAVRQRTAELAVRRVHGARARTIAALVSVESLIIAVVGGAIGLAVADVAVLWMGAVNGWPVVLSVPLHLAAAAAAIGMCLVAAIPPALVAVRIRPNRAFAVE